MSYKFDHSLVDGDLSFRTRFQTGIRIVPSLTENLPSRTKQADAKAANINNIVARYRKSGELPIVNRAPMFGDLSMPDYKEAMDIMAQATQSFAALPAALRAEFNNDPSLLLEALDNASDPEVHTYLYKIGLLAEPPEAKAEPIEPKPSPAKGARLQRAGAPKPDPVGSDEGE